MTPNHIELASQQQQRQRHERIVRAEAAALKTDRENAIVGCVVMFARHWQLTALYQKHVR